MIGKCHICGKIIFTFFKSITTCPQCGSELTSTKSVQRDKLPAGLKFPQREHPSIEDTFKRNLAEAYEGGGISRAGILDTWENLISRRRFDAPFYTAIKNRASIAIYFSSRSLSSEEKLVSVLNSRLALPLQIKTFLRDPFPIVRCNLVIPDDPTNPYCLESPLNICEGDVQDFFRAALADEYVDLIVKHEMSDEETYYAVECHAPGISRIVEREVKKAIRALRLTSTREDFMASANLIETEFPSPISGVDPKKCILLRVCGKSRNEIITYGDL